MTGSLFNRGFSELFDFQREIDRYFGRDVFQGTTYSRGVVPAVNLFERKDELVVTAEIPGINQNELENNVLTLSGEKKPEDAENVSYHRRERDYGRFSRSIQLPYKVDSEKASADYRNGILFVTVAKAEEAKPRQIKIN